MPPLLHISGAALTSYMHYMPVYYLHEGFLILVLLLLLQVKLADGRTSSPWPKTNILTRSTKRIWKEAV